MLFVAHSWDKRYKEVLYRAAARIYEATEDHPICDMTDYHRLCALLPTLKIDRSLGTPHAKAEGLLHGKTIVFGENATGITSCRLCFDTDVGRLYYRKDGSEHMLPFGYGEYT